MNNATNTNDIKMNIIDLLTKINDAQKLKLIFRQAEALESAPKGQLSTSKLKDATVDIKENLTLDDIYEEQGCQPIDYQEFRKLADQIEWDFSLEELLANLD
jgi:hypothetical protein